MRTFKRRRTKNGKTTESSRWYITWHDSRNDLRHTWQAFTDKRSSTTMGRKLEAVASHGATGEQLTDDLRAFVDSLSLDHRKNLVELSLVDRAFVTRSEPITKHIEDWIASKADVTQKQRRKVELQATKLLEAAKVETLADLKISKLNNAIAELAKGPKPKSKHTQLSYKGSIEQFLKWLNKRELVQPLNLAALDQIKNVKTELERSPLSITEQKRLIANAAAAQPFEQRGMGGAIRNSVDGWTRSLVYRLVMETGLRAKEVSALTAADFNLMATVPTLRLVWSEEKNHKGTTFNLRAATVELLREHLQHKAPAAAAFNLPGTHNMAKMVRTDLDAARRAWIAEAGEDFDEQQRREKSDTLAHKRHDGSVVDFHALRNTFITNLALADVPIVTASKLARHSDINLTMKLYAKVGKAQTAEALDTLPDYDDDEQPTTHQATGTTDSTEVDRQMDYIPAPSTGNQRDAIGDSEPETPFRGNGEGTKEGPTNLGKRCSILLSYAGLLGNSTTTGRVRLCGEPGVTEDLRFATEPHPPENRLLTHFLKDGPARG